MTDRAGDDQDLDAAGAPIDTAADCIDEGPAVPDGGDELPDDLPTCDEAGCRRPAAVRLHVPWSDDRAVCTAHARVLARPDGVVAEPIEGAEAEWP